MIKRRENTNPWNVSKHFVRTGNMLKREDLVERILTALRKEPLCYGEGSFYEFYAKRFNTTPERLEAALDYIEDKSSCVIRDRSCRSRDGIIKYIDTRFLTLYRERAKNPDDSEPKSIPTPRNIPNETGKQVEKWMRLSKNGKRPGASVEIKEKDTY